jgi:RNA polymerase sigma-70 factor (ECF subfamily)
MSAAASFADLTSLADDTLMVHVCRGCDDALAVLFDRYHRLVLRVALRILRDLGEAEDMTQSVFLEIFRSATRFDSAKGSAKVWILQFAYNGSFNRRKYLNIRGFYNHPNDQAPLEKDNSSPNKRELGSLESARAVQQALGQLNKIQRNILELAFYEGLTMHEISQTTGHSFDSTRHHYYRGMEKLRSILSETCGTEEKTSPEGGVAHV